MFRWFQSHHSEDEEVSLWILFSACQFRQTGMIPFSLLWTDSQRAFTLYPANLMSLQWTVLAYFMIIFFDYMFCLTLFKKSIFNPSTITYFIYEIFSKMFKNIMLLHAKRNDAVCNPNPPHRSIMLVSV